MKLVRLTGRSWYRVKSGERKLSRYDRILVPVPIEHREIIRPWLGQDLKVKVEPIKNGFGILVYPENYLYGLYTLSRRFEILMTQLRRDTSVDTF